MGVCSYCHKYQSEHEECFGWGEAASFCGVERPKISAIDRNWTETPMTNNLKAERTITAEELPKTELERAAHALLNNLWQKVYSGSRTFEENWDAMDRTYPASKWLQDELKAFRSQSLSTQQPMGEVRVKALEWSGIIPGRIYADIYMIERLELDDWRLFLRSNSHGDWPTFLAGPFSLDEAKSAAQEDYRQRILSALHPNQESGE